MNISVVNIILKFWFISILLSSTYCLAQLSCDEFFNDSQPTPFRLVFQNTPLVIETNKPLFQRKYILASGSEVILEPRESRDREGDPITVLEQRKDRNERMFLLAGNTDSLWDKLIKRYYLSFTIRKQLLNIRSNTTQMSGRETFNGLLPEELVSNPKFPRLRPAASLHEDYHYFRNEYDSLSKTEYFYESEGLRQKDLSDLKIRSGLRYKFHGHGDSYKYRTVSVGQRAELITEYKLNNGLVSHDIQIYQKSRFNGEGKVVARTIVFKIVDKTLRVRLPLNLNFNIESIIREVLIEKFQMANPSVRSLRPFMKLRQTIKIVIGAKLEQAQEIGRLTIDTEAYLEKPIDEDILNGKKSFWGNYFYGFPQTSNLGSYLEHVFQKQNGSNHVISRKVILVTEIDKHYESDIDLFTDDLASYFSLGRPLVYP